MKKILAPLCIALFAHTAAQANVMKAEFTSHRDWDSGTIATVASVGSLTLTLNGNGTIGAQLSVLDNQQWMGVAVDSGNHYTESAIAQGAETGWGTGFGTFNTGLVCGGPMCTGSTTWTIGTAGQFTSVAQVLSGNGSAYDAFFYTSRGEYAGMMTEAAAVPEPASIALFTLGMAGVAAARRRARTRACAQSA
jgi:membrane-bound inhibitor of C-type lysozyme